MDMVAGAGPVLSMGGCVLRGVCLIVTLCDISGLGGGMRYECHSSSTNQSYCATAANVKLKLLLNTGAPYMYTACSSSSYLHS